MDDFELPTYFSSDKCCSVVNLHVDAVKQVVTNQILLYLNIEEI
jgi:hypothetical protein